MVVFTFNAHGHFFQAGLASLRRGSEVAVLALDAEMAQHRRQLEAFDGSPVARLSDALSGDWPPTDVVLRCQITLAQDAQCDVRKAFVLSAYHLWERSAQRWTGRGDREHAALAAHTVALGYPVHPDLELVRCLANALKHNKRKAGEVLVKAWPELTPVGAPGDASSWYDAILVSGKALERVFTIIAQSGPNHSTPPGEAP